MQRSVSCARDDGLSARHLARSRLLHEETVQAPSGVPAAFLCRAGGLTMPDQRER